MLKLVTTLLGLTLTLGLAQAQETERSQFPLGATCEATVDLEEFISGYGEKAFASSDAVIRGIDGKFYEGKLVIYVSPKTFGTTVVVEFPQDEISCILALGENFGPVTQDPGI